MTEKTFSQGLPAAADSRIDPAGGPVLFGGGHA
jgi:hypothetical protein